MMENNKSPKSNFSCAIYKNIVQTKEDVELNNYELLHLAKREDLQPRGREFESRY